MSSSNLRRRKSVMARSIKLGHCVCNPRQPCPCDTFKQYNVCQCAGEKMPAKSGAVALTRMVKKAGCSSKIGQADLLRILGKLPLVNDPNVLLGTAAGDDAGVYRISDSMALVQTVDVFSPVVDDPYAFGQIAAANSVSDIYAMGGKPLTALSIIGFPIDDFDGEIMETILRGGMDKLAEAECALLGGHSINDDELKFGFAVTGIMDPRDVIARGCARAGDVLVLTKPLGTGMISFAGQIGRLSEGQLAEAAQSMASLNRDAAANMKEFKATACTDVTGFGLAGHLIEMARGSGVVAEIDLEKLPVFSGAMTCLEEEILPGSTDRNEEYSMAWIEADDETIPWLPIIFDPQTSGGLLVSLPAGLAEAYVSRLHELGHTAASIIGRFSPLPESRMEGFLRVRGKSLGSGAERQKNQSSGTTLLPREASTIIHKESIVSEGDKSCCGSGEEAAMQNPDAGLAFGEFMKLANKPVHVNARAKKLMAVALSVAQRCRPCAVIHIKGALAMGISQAEIDEAANLAIAFAGCPSMMMYKEVMQEIG